MTEKDTDFKNPSFHAIWKALVILLIGLILTCLSTYYTYKDVESISKSEYELICKEIKSKIVIRLHAHAQLLRSAASFFAASDTVTRDKWKRFYTHSNLNKNLPGIQGIGYALIIPKNKLQDHISRMHKEGFPDYKVTPAGERYIYSSAIYIEPFEGRNLRAFGYDMLSEPIRRKAMEISRDNDIETLSGKVILVQETNQDVQAGTLMFVPVYTNGMPVNTTEERRSAIKGWVYSPYRMNDLMEGILGPWDYKNNKRIHLHIYDGYSVTAQSELYNSSWNDTVKQKKELSSNILVLPINFNGKIWTLAFSILNNDNPYYQNKAVIVFTAGIVISFLIFGLLFTLISTNSRAKKLAFELTSELRESETKFRKMADDAPIMIWESGTDKLFYSFNKEWLDFTGRTLEHEIGNGWTEGVHPDDLEMCLEAYNSAFDYCESFSLEYRLKHHSGDYRWIMVNGTPRFTEDGTFWGFIGTCTDTSDIKKNERIILSFAEKYKTLLETSRDGMHLLDIKGNLIECNESFCKMLGYEKEEILSLNVIDWDVQIPLEKIIDILNELIDKPALFETKHRKKNGEIIFVEINAAGVEIDDKKYLYASARDITDRKNAEIELARERQRLSDILKGTNVGTWEWNIRTGETIFNERWAEILGYTIEEISPVSIETWMKFAHPDDLKVSEELLKKHFKGELDYYEFESRMKHKDGSWVWILDRGRVHEWDLDGKPVLMSGTHQDITERKLSEEKLKASETKLSAILENSSEAIGVHVNGIWEICNPAAIKLFGVDSAYELLGKSILNVIVPDERDRITEFVRNRMQGSDAPLVYLTQGLRKDGTEFEMEVTLSSFMLDEKKHVFVILRDITERKLAEETLKESEEKYRFLFENMTNGFSVHEVITDENGEPIDFSFIETNEYYKQFSGYDKEEVKGKTIREMMPDVDLEMVKKYCNVGITGEPFQLEYYSYSFNKYIRVNCYSPQKGFFASIFEDITDRKIAEEQIKLKNEQLIKTNAEKDKFFSIVAHDLRAPFSGFLGLTKIMAEELQTLSVAELQKFSQSMQASANNLYKLIENLLEWSRMQRGLIEFKPKPLELSFMIHHNFNMMNEIIQSKEIEISYKIPDDVLINVDESMFNSIMRNLLSNSVKFTHKGGVIEVGTKSLTDEKSGEICIYIRDNGIGMNADTISRLFKLDEKVSRPGTDNEPSTGLGLLLCKDFIEKHGGSFWVESEEEKGSTFYFTLPKVI